MTEQLPPVGVVDDDVAGVPLERQAARGVLVSVSGQLARVVVQFAGTIVLARMLDPRDYGLLAVSILVVGVGEILRDFGLRTAAIQARTLSQAQRSNLFWINTMIGTACAVIVVAAAPLLTLFFDDHDVVAMVRACALTFVINGVATQYRANLTRAMKFGQLVRCDLGGQAIGVALAITAAVLGAGYWALVLLVIGQYGSALVLLVMVSRWRPSLPRRHAGMRPLLRFGGHLVSTQLLYYLGNNLDVLTISARFSPASLGVYNRAYTLVSSPLGQVRAPATTVAVPVLSRLGEDHDTAGRYLERAQLALGYVLGPALALCAGASAAIVELLLGSRWAAAAPMFAMLAVANAASILAFVGLWAYLSRGLGSELMRYTLLTLVLQAACILFGSQWGVDGVAAGYMTAALVEWPLSLWWLSRQTVIPLGALYRGAARIMGVSVLVGVAAFAATRLPTSPTSLVALLLAVVAAVGTYALLAALPTVRADLAAVLRFVRLMRGRRAEASVESSGRSAGPTPAPEPLRPRTTG